jgi:RhtB (resistance to homoserine/threonine) family protein
MFITQLITIASIHLLAVISPGPDFAMVTKNSLLYSRKTGIYTAIGLGCGIAVHVAYSLLGIGLLISQSIVLFTVIKYLGAAYLIYIGYKSLKAKPQTVSTETEIQKSDKTLSAIASIRQGFFTNVLNPKVTLFFLALFTQVVSPETPLLFQLTYGLEMMLATVLWFSLVAVFFSNSFMKAKITKVSHHIERVTGVVLIGLGIKVALASHK